MGFAHVIPQLTQKILNLNKRKIIIHNAKHKRTFCNIEFAIDLIFNISHKKKLTNKIFNIGSPEKEISIMELAQKIKKILNSKNQLISSNSQKDSSPEKRKPDMKRSLKYSKINHNFEKGLKETVIWYKKYCTR
jgi:Nucleoside-diphosphate-sugar epimerases